MEEEYTDVRRSGRISVHTEEYFFSFRINERIIVPSNVHFFIGHVLMKRSSVLPGTQLVNLVVISLGVNNITNDGSENLHGLSKSVEIYFLLL